MKKEFKQEDLKFHHFRTMVATRKSLLRSLSNPFAQPVYIYKPIATLAWYAVDDKQLMVSCSRCHPNDQFTRKLGRVKATGLMNGGHSWLINGKSTKDVIDWFKSHFKIGE